MAAAIALASSAAAKKDEQPVNPGPQPSEAEFHRLAEQAALAGFFDPGSAQFQWPFALVGGYYKPVLQGKKIGWWTCGLVNGKNRMGGYVGFRQVVAVVRDGAVVFSAIGDGSAYDFIAGQCQQSANKGLLKPAGTIGPPAPDPSEPQFGFFTSPVPDGLYIARVTPGSVAEAGGIVPGMVMTKVNGLPIKGMDMNAAGQLLRAADGAVTFSFVGHADMTLTKAPIAAAR